MIIYEDENEIIITDGAEDALAIGVHVGCGGWVDKHVTSKGKKDCISCRACKFRVYIDKGLSHLEGRQR